MFSEIVNGLHWGFNDSVLASSIFNFHKVNRIIEIIGNMAYIDDDPLIAVDFATIYRNRDHNYFESAC